MEIKLNHEKKLCTIWMSSDEAQTVIPDELSSEIRLLKANNYAVVILRSGSGNLFEDTLALLKDNRLRSAFEEDRCSKEEMPLQTEDPPA